jgi:hypothetical protein
MEKGLHHLAKALQSSGNFEFCFHDFQTLCIETGIGMDRRTAENWCRVAKVKGLISRKNPNNGIYTKGPLFEQWLHPKSRKEWINE